MVEKDVSKLIKNLLSNYESCGVVAWWGRLNSGKVRVGAHFINMSPIGTPDFMAVIHNNKGGLSVCFIEAKSDKGKLRPEQVSFAMKYSRIKDFYVLKISDVKLLQSFINSICVDKLKEIKWPTT